MWNVEVVFVFVLETIHKLLKNNIFSDYEDNKCLGNL